ncbi:extracellular solute-binding protein [Paenibacillus sp. Marseille-Q4541]|uniref:extracellular solute-binding protein n=1 Tax=Paenibacillus sp. Marseille-Q4541 TaxID=2831522 RepID=UPI001BAD694B|nr:extracellular solute-binding protein [Paenibacillus sp. Marseille-Q4541]
MNKKLLKTGLALTLFTSLLAGCGTPKSASTGPSDTAANVSKEGFPIVEKPITLSMMGKDTGMQNWNDMVVFDEMEKLTNIKLEFRNAPMDSFDTKKNLVFASGDLPDMFYAAELTKAEEVNYGTQGILIPLEQLIEDYAPNIKKVLEENPDIKKSITTPDGHIYSLPRIDLTAVWNHGPIWYNGAYLEALGVDKLPETTEEFYTYLKRIKEEDPNGNGKADEIPLVSVKIEDIRRYFEGAFGLYDEVIYTDDDNKVRYTPMEEGYRGYLTYLNRLWEEKLLDPETFSQTDEQKKSKGKSDRVGLFSDWHPYFTLGGEPDTADKMMIPLKSDMVDKPAYGKSTGLSTGAFAISSTNPAPEATMRWVDYLYTYEGSTLFDKGPEGTMWKYVGENTKEKEEVAIPGGGDREEFRATLTPNYGIVSPGITIPEVNLGLKTEFDEWVDKETAEKLAPIARVPYPNVYLTPEEQEEASRLRSDLDKYVEEMEAKFITGQESLDKWDSYVEQLKKMGAERVAEIYQGAYDKWAQQPS